MCYATAVKPVLWNPQKNELLKKERGVSFEEVVVRIAAGELVRIYLHPNQERYPGQKIAEVLVDDYVYLVPFVETEAEIFLKTIIPSRKATKSLRGDR